MTPTEQDDELRDRIHSIVLTFLLSDRRKKVYAKDLTHKLMQLITADRKRVALEARIDTATDILYGFSRTYKQEVTDSAGNVYVDESHDYISKYEVQELVAKLKAQQEEK